MEQIAVFCSFCERILRFIDMEQKRLTYLFNQTPQIFVINGKNSFVLGLKFVLITFIKQLLKRIKKTMSQKHRAFNKGIVGPVIIRSTVPSLNLHY